MCPNIFENGDFFLRIWKNLKNPRPILQLQAAEIFYDLIVYVFQK